PSVDPLVLATYDQLLDLFMPPALLIDESGSLIDAFSGAEKLLKLRPRRPSGNVLEMFEPELRTILAGAMQRAVRDRKPVSYKGVRIGGEERQVTVQALSHPRTGASSVLVTFRDMVAEARPPADVDTLQPAPTASERLVTLE